MLRSIAPRILFANSHVWGGQLKIGAEHIAEQFHADGWHVLYLSSPLSPLHFVHPRSRKQAWRKLKMIRPVEVEQKADFRLLCPLTFFPHVNIFPFSLEASLMNWSRLTLPPLGWQIRQLGFDKSDLIFFDNVAYWPFFKNLPGKKIYRIADRIERFPVVTTAMLDLHREIIKKADLVVYTAHDLEDMLTERTGPSLFLPNGVNHELFSTPTARPVEYERLEGPILLYMGAIEDWFDCRAFNEATAKLPDMSFVLIAPPSSCLEKIIMRKNVHYLGAKAHSSLPAFVQHADMGLIPFDMQTHEALLNSVCPLKLFEYLAGGLPVICYDSAEIRDYHAPVAYYSPDVPLHEAIVQQLSERGSAKINRDLKSFSLQFDWKNRYKALQTRITTLE